MKSCNIQIETTVRNVLSLVFFFTLSCDNSLEPVDKNLGSYSVYGVLDLNNNKNYIRVRYLKAPFTVEATKEIDASVVLEDLDSGSSQILRNARTQYKGVFQHNFEVDEVVPNTEYRLKIEKSDGRLLELQTKTPSLAVKSITPEARNCKTPITFELSNLNGGSIEYVLSSRRMNLDEPLFFEAFYKENIRVFKPDENNPQEPLSVTFVLGDGPGTPDFEECRELNFNKYYVTFIYYSKGLQENISRSEFDVLESTIRFGALYADQFAIEFDTTMGAK